MLAGPQRLEPRRLGGDRRRRQRVGLRSAPHVDVEQTELHAAMVPGPVARVAASDPDGPQLEGDAHPGGRLAEARVGRRGRRAFASMFVVYGIVYSFGAFFDSMAEDFGTGKGATALMFSITTAWYFGLGLVSGKAADRFGPRPVLLVAAVDAGSPWWRRRGAVDLGRA